MYGGKSETNVERYQSWWHFHVVLIRDSKDYDQQKCGTQCLVKGQHKSMRIIICRVWIWRKNSQWVFTEKERSILVKIQKGYKLVFDLLCIHPFVIICVKDYRCHKSPQILSNHVHRHENDFQFSDNGHWQGYCRIQMGSRHSSSGQDANH